MLYDSRNDKYTLINVRNFGYDHECGWDGIFPKGITKAAGRSKELGCRTLDQHVKFMQLWKD